MTEQLLTPHPANNPRNRHPAGALIALAAFAALALAQAVDQPAGGAEAGPDRLTSRPRPTPPADQPIRVGDEVQTGAGQRRRVELPEGVVLYLHQNTRIKVDQAQQVSLSTGEVLVQLAGRKPADARLVIKTPQREVTGRAAKFAVRTDGRGTGVLVTRGQVTVSGLDTPVRAGQQLAPDAARPGPAPEAVQRLDWARELLAAETPLVPGSDFAGGALVAVDSDGQEARLRLRKHHIDVHIEDGFARTTIDQTYFNHDTRRLEGSFRFQVPPDASLSRLAMYVDGRLMEGGMVERDYARDVFEEIVYRQKDPALLEWQEGGLFTMRVFPLEGRQEKRILLSYTQKLPIHFGRLQYRCPAGPGRETVRDWSLHARIKGGYAADTFLSWDESPSFKPKARRDGRDWVLDATASKVKADRDVVVTVGESGTAPPVDAARFAKAEHEGARYLMLRYRPTLPAVPRPERRDWVFLFESSGDRDPLLARAQVEIIRSLLAEAEPNDTFAVLAAGTRVRAFAPESRPVTAANVQDAIAFLESAHLVGALDLGRALTEAAPLLKSAKAPTLVHVGSGIAALGERRADVLARRIPAGTRYVGVGVGRRWARGFMKTAAERTGGCFTQINPDEPIAWRAFELAATLNAPRLLNAQVRDEAGRATFLTVTDSLAQGEELCAIAHLGPDNAALPESVVITGTLDGKPFRQAVPVKDVAGRADYLPRTWAKLEIDQLLAMDVAKHKQRIIDLSKAMYVMTPFTSMLVLESDEMYVQYKVDRGRKDHWAMYDCPQKIEVVYEPEPGQPADPRAAAKGVRPTARQVLDTIQVRGLPRLLRWPGEEKEGSKPLPAGGVAGVTFTFDPLPPAGFISGLTPERISTSGVDAAIRTQGVRRPVPPYGGLPSPEEVSKYDINGLGVTLEPPGRERLYAARPETGGFFAAGEFIPYEVTEIAPARVGQVIIVGNEVTRHDVILRQVPLYPGQILTHPDFRNSGSGMIAVHGFVDFDPSKDLAVPGAFFGSHLAAVEANQAGPSLSLLYQRPSFAGDERTFSNLVGYAPGMNTSGADMLAVLEAEAASSPRSRAGHIDAAARQLLDKARPAGWQTLTLPAEADQPALAIAFDGQGRYAWERQLPPALREQVVCDGKTLLHLYPDLGIGARRSVGRFHRLDFARLVPWALPPAEDLARGADLRVVGERTVGVVPHGADSARDRAGKPLPYVRVHLVFAAAGRLAERQLVEMPAGKVLYREVIGAEGAIRVLDEKGKELSVSKGALGAAEAPDLKPDIRKLVVLPLPYRACAHVLQALQIDKKRYEDLRSEDGLALFAADFGALNGSEAEKVFRQAFHGRGQRQLGFYVLLAACGQNLDSEHVDVLAEHLNEPLAQYLALYSSPVLRKHASQWAVGTGQWAGGFLQHLAVSHALFQRWQTSKVRAADAAQRQADRDRALDYVRRNKGSAFGWALLGLLQDRAADKETDKQEAVDTHRALADAWLLFEEVPGLAYSAKYEHARSLWKSGQHGEARKKFRELYEQTFAADRLPAIDGDFRQALLGDARESGDWTGLLRRTAEQFIDKKRRPAALALAWQCWQLGDEPMANHLLGTALAGAPEGKERLALSRTGVRFFMETGQYPQADQLLRRLLDNPDLAKRADLWRLAGELAGKRDQRARELECLERALEAEFRNLPAVIDLKAVRRDYDKLLEHYQKLADAMIVLKLRPPADFVARVVRAADRWRALDSRGTAACEAAARILQTLGETDLVWDYLTTPIGLEPGQSGPWVNLAQTLSRKGELELADRAFHAAFEAEPTNAQVLWDRAQGLLQAGKRAEARQVFRQLAEGQWQPRFQWLQTQAQRHVEN